MGSNSFVTLQMGCHPLSSVASALTYALVAGVLSGCGSAGSGAISPTCGRTCAAGRANENASTGFTDNTGFAGDSASDCCNICAVEGAKLGHGQYEWDFLTMDYLYVPQFCHALEDGHDFTLTNTDGSKCTEASASLPQIQIHGLWPDWTSDFSTCCGSAATVDPVAARDWTIFNDLQRKWVDAAADPSCSVCYNLNHEWQKHGTCFTNEPETYFRVGLDLEKSMAAHMTAIQGVLDASAGSTILAADIVAAWNASFTVTNKTPYAINLICDPHSETSVNGTSVNYISEIQVCWKRISTALKGSPVNSSAHLELMHCPAATKRGFTQPCGTTLAVYGTSRSRLVV